MPRIILLFLSFLSLVVVSASGALQLRETTTANPSATIQVTLQAGTAGSTTLGTSATSASTTGATLPILNGPTNVLKVHRGSTDWDVQVKHVSLSGAGILDSMTVSLVAGSAVSQVVVALGSVTQTIGSAVTLNAANPDLTVRATGACLGTCTFGLQIILKPVGGTQPVMTYNYSLAVT